MKRLRISGDGFFYAVEAEDGEFVSYVDAVASVAEACWLWPGYTNEDGYARKNGVGVHRIMWELTYGPIPEGLEIDHLCRVRNCIRPDHLQAVDHRTNTMRGGTIPAYNGAKTHCPQGHPYDEQNTRIDRLGKRYCRACGNERRRAARKAGKP